MPRYNARNLALAWLAVHHGYVPKAGGALGRTILLEHHDAAGARLVATDGHMLLTAWVPDADDDLATAPPFDTEPDRRAVLLDTDKRAAGLMAYLLTVVGLDPDDDDAVELDVRVNLDALRPADRDEVGRLPGMAPRVVAIDVPDLERVYVERWDGTYPTWATLLDGHTGVTTTAIELNPDLLGRIGKVGRTAGAAVRWTFAGPDKPARITVDGPIVQVDGLVMPSRWEHAEPPADEATEAAHPETR